MTSSFFMSGGSDRPHHQACVGTAEADTVVEDRLHLPFLRLVGHQVDAGGPFTRIVEVECRRHDLVAHRKNAEDCLHGAGTTEQMANCRFRRTHRQPADIVAEKTSYGTELELVAKGR